MPITQDRMLTLLAAAQDYQQAWDRAAHFATKTEQAVEGQYLSKEEAYHQLLMVLRTPMQLLHPVLTGAAIEREREHFRLFKARNIRTAEKQRQRRGRPPRVQHATNNFYLDAERAEVEAEGEMELELPEYEVGDRLSPEEKERIERELGDTDK